MAFKRKASLFPVQGGELFDPLQNFKKQLERVTHLILDVRTFLLFAFSSGLVVSSFHWSNSGRTAKYPLQQVLNIRFVMNKVYKIVNSSELFHCLMILEQIQNADCLTASLHRTWISTLVRTHILSDTIVFS